MCANAFVDYGLKGKDGYNLTVITYLKQCRLTLFLVIFPLIDVFKSNVE